MQDLRWPTYALRDVTLERAEPHERGGLRVIDSEGRSYLDAVNGVGCAPLGHGHPRWVAAVHAQMQRLTAAANSFTSGPQQALARQLAERFPVRAAFSMRKQPGRVEYLRGRLQRDGGTLAVALAGAQGSGVLSSMSEADCFVVLPADCSAVQEGDTVLVQPFHGIV